MGSMICRKGVAGERENSDEFVLGSGDAFPPGRQYHGGPESPDLASDLLGLHLDVKRHERLSLYRPW